MVYFYSLATTSGTLDAALCFLDSKEGYGKATISCLEDLPWDRGGSIIGNGNYFVILWCKTLVALDAPGSQRSFHQLNQPSGGGQRV